jgi:hypothetical protein
MRRALVLTLLLLAVAPAAARAAQVTVVSPNGQQHPVSLDALLASPDVQGREYVVRGERGSTRRTVTGVSLAAVLKAADARVDQFKYAEVQDASRSVLFSRDQALSDDWDAGPPVFYVDGADVRFLRPSAGGDDLNGADELSGPGGLTIRLRQKVKLTIRASASKRRAEVGEQVTFTAEIGGVGAGETATVSWLFGSDGTGSGTTTRHRFRKAGTYRVLATVTTPGDEVGASAIVTVKVGKASEDEDDDEEPAGDTSSSGAGLGGSGAGGGTGFGSGSGSGLGSGGGSGAATGSADAGSRPAEPARTRRRDREPERRDRPATDEPVPGEIEGELLQPVEHPVRTRMVSSAPEQAEQGGGLGVPAEAWSALGTSLALAIGFALERRRWRRSMTT